jgi:hypothetical protein
VPVTPELIRALVDDAGLFPPEGLAMAAAVARHRADGRAGSAVLSHRFVCPDDRLGELRAALTSTDRIRLSVIAALRPEVLHRVAENIGGDGRLTLVAVEGVLPDRSDAARAVAEALARLPSPVPAFVEVPLRDARAADRAIAALADRGLAAKFRCGGVRADLFPDQPALAGAIISAVRRGIPFKATAGLHHAVGHRDVRTGSRHFGFLNLLLAANRAVLGESAAAVGEVLGSTDAAALAAEACAVDAGAAARTRSGFVSFGSCSTAAPLTDLAALGLWIQPGPGNRAVRSTVGPAVG